jgi:hypothetical protein
VFFDGSYIGTIIDNKIHFFEGDEDGLFTQISDMDFELPNGYSNVISAGLREFCFIQNDTLHFFEYENGWHEKTDLSFAIPKGTKSIILNDHYRLGVVFDGYIQFHWSLGTPRKWQVNSARTLFEFGTDSNIGINNQITIEPNTPVELPDDFAGDTSTDNATSMSLRSYKINGEEMSSALKKEVTLARASTGSYILIIRKNDSTPFARYTFRYVPATDPLFMVLNNETIISGAFATITKRSNGLYFSINSTESGEATIEIDIYY